MLMIALAGAALFAGARLTRSVSARPAELVTPFLYPPYYGRSTEESIFDHSSPNYNMTDNKVVTYLGETLNKACPNPAPAGTPPPNGLCDYGYGGYWSYRLGAYAFYNGHDGIDYGVSYRPLLAAADANQVVYAGWYNPQDHRSNLGIYVRLRHANGYDTWYGHMSALAVQSCGSVGCANLPHGEVIGISGTTGNSSGPHLHFRITNPQGRAVDPYGWAGQAGLDPWTYNQLESLWVQLPNISASSANVYPSGASLIEPPAAPIGYLVDDLDPRFNQLPPDCWTVINTSAANSQASRMLAVQPITSGLDSCRARWKLPLGTGAGIFAVYVRIPAVHATSEGALYNIVHDGITDVVVLNQAVFPNSSVPDGWVYLGKYYFNGLGTEYVQLGNKTQDVTASASSLEVGADAVRFVPIQTGTAVPSETPTASLTPTITQTPTITPTPTITQTPSKTPTPSITWTPSTTPTPSLTRTPTKTLTSTITKTPTNTPLVRPSDTRWPSRTPSITATRRPTDTRVPSKTPTTIRPTDTRVPTRTLTPSRTPTPSKTFTPSRTATITRTPSPSRTLTPSRTPTITRTFTVTPVTPTVTLSHTPGPSPTQTRWPTLTIRPSSTRWPTRTLTPSRTPTPSKTFTPSRTPALSLTPASTLPPVLSQTLTPSRTPGPSPTQTRWPTLTVRPTDTRWPTKTPITW